MKPDTLQTSKGDEIGIIDGDAESIISIDEFRHRLNVDGWIRMHRDDFTAMLTLPYRLTHFNLGTTSNQLGQRYAVVPILRPGRRTPDGREEVAYVDIRRFRTGLCVSVEQQVALHDLAPSTFENSLPSIRSMAALSAVLIARYAKMHPGLPEDELLARGCAITTLEFDR